MICGKRRRNSSRVPSSRPLRPRVGNFLSERADLRISITVGAVLNEVRVLSDNPRCLASPRRLLASTGYASGVKHPLDARIHLFLFDEFLTVGLRDAFSHGGAKTSVLFKQAQGGILHQSLGILAGMTGDLG
jgi:hypothetical protein